MAHGYTGGEAITAVVATRNRGDGVIRTVESIFANDHPDFRVILVDQSDDDRTRQSLRKFMGRPGFEYVKTECRGLSVGRNEGICHCRTELIAMTDDDCEVAPDWLRNMAAAFQVDKRIGVVLGNVLAGEHDESQGFVPAYVCPEPYLALTIHQKHRVEGIGACMGIRRSMWERMNGFDHQFGAGGRFLAAEELDFMIRGLLAGYAVYTDPAATVVHYGFRSWDTGQKLISGYLFGIGATFAKQVKCGNWSILSLMVRLAGRWAFRGPVVDLGRKPPRWLRLTAFANGFLIALRTPLDRQTGHLGPKAPVLWKTAAKD